MILPIMLLLGDRAAGTVLFHLQFDAFLARDHAVGLGAIFDVVDVLFARLQPIGFAMGQLA